TLADMYAFGALTAYTLVTISHLRLRLSDPYTPRPYKVPGNLRIKIKNKTIDFPLLGILAVIGTFFYFILVLWTHHLARIYGTLWLILGLTLYFVYRKKNGLPLLKSIERDWVGEQIRVLKEAGEVENLEEYIKALEGRENESK
ncbi:MAG: hypothetical protein ACP5QS_03300, partial [bacterium]